MTTWYDRARAVILSIHADLPADATLAERKKALRENYPFHPSMSWPRKAWQKARRDYFARVVRAPEYAARSQSQIPEKHLSPLERMMQKGQQK